MRRMTLVLGLAASLAGCSDDPCGGAPPRSDVPADHVLLDADSPALRVVPPDTFDVRFETTQGPVVVRVFRDWAPLGAYRFYNLLVNGFYDGSRFYRVLPGFAAQFGMSGRPAIDRVWLDRPIPDDPFRQPNRAGTLVFATAGPDTRTTQLFFNYTDNPALDEQGFAPFGRVTQGMDLLFRLYSGYGELQPRGRGPLFRCVVSHGNRYLDRRYPNLDRIERAVVVQ
jgi:peptidyl-prolyl cis-trans isomerase A (cyclophilin A)